MLLGLLAMVEIMWCSSKRIRILVIPQIPLMLMIWVQNTVAVLVHKTVSKHLRLYYFSANWAIITC
jgi:hypothetical protein